MIIIYASNIHSGGGKVLLDSVLQELKSPAVVFVDLRYLAPQLEMDLVKFVKVKPTIFGRLQAEFKLKSLASSTDQVLCFGNLPPLLKLRAKVDLFFQNTILLRKYSNFNFPWKSKVRQSVERFLLARGIIKVDRIFVQSNSVKREFVSQFPGSNVIVIPFMTSQIGTSKAKFSYNDYVYVASGDPHKNHHRLLAAWQILAEQGLFPSLVLTVSPKDRDILKAVDSLVKRGLRITNFANLSHQEVLSLYKCSGALIFPSLTESFGLPLHEAAMAGIPILAAELDYVREFSSPVQTFDPTSEVSISKAVARHLAGRSSEKLQKIFTTEEFLTTAGY